MYKQTINLLLAEGNLQFYATIIKTTEIDTLW